MAENVVANPESRLEDQPGGPSITSSTPDRGISSSMARGGQPLTTATRALVEPTLGLDLGRVRIHTDAEASSMNRSLRARAFTHGPDIYFGRGEYRPDSRAGRRLLVHELAHVAQQQAHPTSAPSFQRSAIASWDDASFEERVATRREELGLNVNLEDITREDPIRTMAARGQRRRQQRRFDRKVRRADPQRYEAEKKEIETRFQDKPGKRDRKLEKLKKKRDKAEERLGLPTLPKILVIEATYHYLPINAVNKQFVQFPPGVIEEVKRKFRVGAVWEGIEYGNRTVAVRFDIQFQAHENLQSLNGVDFSKPGNVPMRTKSIAPPGSGVYSFDFTADREQETPKVTGTGGRFAEANADRIDIDAAAIRKRTTNVRFFEQASDREARDDQSVTESKRVSGRDFSRLMASFIAHEIGHNIGMMHDDLGIMVSSFDVPTPRLQPTPILDDQEQLVDTIYELQDISFRNVEITDENVRLLVSRIDQMTQERSLFWKNEIQRRKTDSDPANDIQDAEFLEGSGFTAFEAPAKK